MLKAQTKLKPKNAETRLKVRDHSPVSTRRSGGGGGGGGSQKEESSDSDDGDGSDSEQHQEGECWECEGIVDKLDSCCKAHDHEHGYYCQGCSRACRECKKERICPTCVLKNIRICDSCQIKTGSFYLMCVAVCVYLMCIRIYNVCLFFYRWY